MSKLKAKPNVAHEASVIKRVARNCPSPSTPWVCVCACVSEGTSREAKRKTAILGAQHRWDGWTWDSPEPR